MEREISHGERIDVIIERDKSWVEREISRGGEISRVWRERLVVGREISHGWRERLDVRK